MAIKRTSSNSISNAVKLSTGFASAAIPNTPTIGTATKVNDVSATVTYTAAVLGATASSFTALSSPGSLTGTGSSPITISGLTPDTAYTFTVRASNANGNSAYSTASNSITTDPISDSGAMFPLGMVQVGSAGSSSISFTSIPQTYTHLQLRIIARNTVADYETSMRVGNGSADSGSNYADHYLLGNGASVFANATTSATSAIIGIEGNTTSNYSAYVCDILDYANTNKYKTFRTLNGVDKNGSGSIRLQSGLWQSTSAINTIELFHAAGNFEQYTSVALYGIKGA